MAKFDHEARNREEGHSKLEPKTDWHFDEKTGKPMKPAEGHVAEEVVQERALRSKFKGKPMRMTAERVRAVLRGRIP